MRENPVAKLRCMHSSGCPPELIGRDFDASAGCEYAVFGNRVKERFLKGNLLGPLNGEKHLIPSPTARIRSPTARRAAGGEIDICSTRPAAADA